MPNQDRDAEEQYAPGKIQCEEGPLKLGRKAAEVGHLPPFPLETEVGAGHAAIEDGRQANWNCPPRGYVHRRPRETGDVPRRVLFRVETAAVDRLLPRIDR